MKKLAILAALVGGMMFFGTGSQAKADHRRGGGCNRGFVGGRGFYGPGFYGSGYAIRGWGYRPAPGFYINTPSFSFGYSNFGYGGFGYGGYGYRYGYGGCNRW